MEITESILMKDTDKVNSDLKRLKSFGIQIALDDGKFTTKTEGDYFN